MAKSFEGIFGGIFDQNVHLRDSRHAANAYGFNKSDLSNGTPRHKFQYFINIKYNDADRDVAEFVDAFLNRNDQELVTQAVKSVTMPSMQIETEVLNQYNKKRISQKRINYTPVSISFHDTVEGRMLRVWEMYYEYYFRDGVASEKLGGDSSGTSTTFFGQILEAFKSGFNGVTAAELNDAEYPDDIIREGFVDNYGYNIKRVGNQKYLIKHIDIFQIHGGKFSRTRIIHPRISGFTHDTLDYEDTSGLVEMRFEFEHEGVVYANINEQLDNDELERFRYGDFHELSNLITIRTGINGRNLKAAGLKNFPDLNTCGPGAASQSGDEQNGGVFSFLNPIVGARNTQLLEDTIGSVVGSIPGAIGSVAAASIFGGTVSFNPDPRDALRSTANQLSRAAVGRTRNAFSAGVAAAVAGTGNAIVNGFTTSGDDEEEELAEGAGDGG